MKPASPRSGTGGTISSDGWLVTLLTWLHHVGDKIAAVERRDVFELLPTADETRRDVQLVLDRDDDAPFATAVELGHDQPGQSDGLMEFARLRERVTAGGRIHHEQSFIGRFLVLFRQTAFHLRQLRHQIAFRVEPAGSVAKK